MRTLFQARIKKSPLVLKSHRAAHCTPLRHYIDLLYALWRVVSLFAREASLLASNAIIRRIITIFILVIQSRKEAVEFVYLHELCILGALFCT